MRPIVLYAMCCAMISLLAYWWLASAALELETYRVELLFESQLVLGEGPVWDSRRNRLLFLDISANQIFAGDVDAKSFQLLATMPFIVGSLALRENGGFILGTDKGFAFADEAGNFEMLTNPEADLQAHRFNEGKCDPRGRFVAGTMRMGSKQKIPEALKVPGSLYSLGTDLSVKKLLFNVSVSNGLVWSLDHRTLYYIDSPTMKLDAFDYDLESGEISNRRTVVHFPPEVNHGDGCTIDHRGNVWVAHFGGGCVTCWNPESGEMLAKILMPVPRVTSIVFGGRDLDVLFVTTAKVGAKADEFAQYPQAGNVYMVTNLGVHGLRSFEFGG